MNKIPVATLNVNKINSQVKIQRLSKKSTYSGYFIAVEQTTPATQCLKIPISSTGSESAVVFA
jgi:hypothetical protein